MTDEELAKHWNVSLEEVKSISDYMNKTYYLTVGKSKSNGLYYGCLFKIEDERSRLVVSSNQGFATADEAAEFMSTKFDNLELPTMKAELMGVPVDAYKTLKKIELEQKSTEKEHTQGTNLHPQQTAALRSGR